MQSAVVDQQRQHRPGRQRVAHPSGLQRPEEEKQLEREIQHRKKHTVADSEVERQRTRTGEQHAQVHDQRREREADHAGQQEMHPDQAGPVMKHDVDLHRQGDRHGQGQRIDGAEQRDLRVLPQDVAAAVPRVPEWRRRILDDVLEHGAVIEQVLVPIQNAGRLRRAEERRAENGAQDAVETDPQYSPLARSLHDVA